jgi:hypothetical protein
MISAVKKVIVKNVDKKLVVRYIFSSLVTFLAGFAIVLYDGIDNVTMESFKDGSVVGLLFVAVRAGFKAVLELIVVGVKAVTTPKQ